MQDRGPQQARLSRIGPGINEVAIDVVHCLVCVQSSSGMRFAFQAQGKALLHFGCTGAMLCVSSLLQDWAGYSDPRWSALTGSVGSKQQSSLAKTAADKAEADKTAAAEETAAGQAAADKTAAQSTLKGKRQGPRRQRPASAPAPAATSPPSELGISCPRPAGHGHEMPSNFDPACQAAWHSLPAQSLPTSSQCKGRLSYTTCSPNGASVEVQLKSKAFLYKKLKGGKPFLDKPSTHAWTKHGDVVQAWKACKAALGWDD